jgi:hypothetical protein
MTLASWHKGCAMKILNTIRSFLFRAALATVAVFLMLPAQGRAQSAPSATSPSLLSPVVDYFADWFPRVTRIQSEQPHWVTPLVTVTPRLEEEFRYDQLWQAQSHGKALDNFGANKGLELIPFQNTEIILGVPGWIAHNGALPRKPKKGKKPGPKPASDGWADETFLIKYRILSGNEENGDYILTAFMGFSVPTGDDGNSNGHTIYTPTIAFGKGFGDFDFQSTVGVAIPNGGVDRLSMPLSWNTAFQYRIFRYFWPELEFNYTWFTLGENTGKSQLFVTPGLIIGRIPIHDRVGMTFGAGYQVAVTHHPAYNNAVIATGRIPF